jgi:hypothetical protein
VHSTLLLWICSIGFLASVPLVLAWRTRRPRLLPWWLVVIFAAALGWIASNAYAVVETREIAAWREADSHEGMIAEYWQVANSADTLPWGWIVGLLYLIVCLGLYRLFRESVNRGASRPLIALSTVAVALAVTSRIPPWIPVEVDVPFDFVFLYTAFLICVGPSLQLLRLFRSQAAWQPFVVMFLVTLLFQVAFRFWALWQTERALMTWASLFPRVQQAADWAALFGGLFSAFWWIAIRSPALRHPQHGRSPEQ